MLCVRQIDHVLTQYHEVIQKIYHFYVFLACVIGWISDILCCVSVKLTMYLHNIMKLFRKFIISMFSLHVSLVGFQTSCVVCPSN